MEVDNPYVPSGSTTDPPNHPDTMVTEKAPCAAASASNAVVYSPELLHMYYSHLFPYSLLHTWLSYGSKKNNKLLFSRREFSFTIEPTPGEEIYIRYQSFADAHELASAILHRRPVKIDIGAVFSHPPKDHNAIQTGKFRPEQRELVFDIDLTDYDEIRKCGCSGAQICQVCWGFMKMAVKVMDLGLRQDFGFEHIGWFYSGRRGVHAWVCDESARLLTDEGRSSVANYFEVHLGSDKNKEMNLSSPLHPMLLRAHEILEPLFIEQVLPSSGHGLLASRDQWTVLLDSLPEIASPVRDKLRSNWASNNKSSPAERWEELKMHVNGFLKQSSKSGNNKATKTLSTKDRNRLENWPVEVVFRYTYPRLDINVSKMRNHLLKSPFCVHPKTGRVCVPIQPHKIDEFDPFAVPTLSQLVQELDQAANRTTGKSGDTNDENKSPLNKATSVGGKNHQSKWDQTSLKSYLEPFQKEFLDPLIKKAQREDRDAAEEQAALHGDF